MEPSDLINGTRIAFLYSSGKSRTRSGRYREMTRLYKNVFATALTLALLITIASPASAQFRRRDRDRGDLSTGEKVAIIGGSAAAGAVVGGLLKGKTGAIIGGLLGGGAGTAYSVIKDRDDDDRWRDRDRRGWRNNRWRDRNDNDWWRYNRNRRFRR
jgi:hypothetical protein